MNKLIITCAICGAGTKKTQTPYVPVTPEEIANEVPEIQGIFSEIEPNPPSDYVMAASFLPYGNSIVI